MFCFAGYLLLLTSISTCVAGARIGSLDHVMITTEPEGHSETHTLVSPQYFRVEDPILDELTDTLKGYEEYPEMPYLPIEETEETVPIELPDLSELPDNLSELPLEQIPEEIEEDITSVCETKACMDLMAKFASWKESRHEESKPGSGRWG
ncbi:hypothetical protein LOTGIDRAFT_164411 [Lottia gigantea]|uniref:Uncharacterized protein n=1 Tax=Lottia gigantea TaxID=225164 RepID=V4A9X8_LOTGI|nr:hypothetical protein LOTGIDRAFT_164411 [Lottia gigantea]ESO90106.1 hypothetical protein LOTGIDRAFT_164411 [Lottia gigantea]